jgi:hypothetical protein
VGTGRERGRCTHASGPSDAFKKMMSMENRQHDPKAFLKVKGDPVAWQDGAVVGIQAKL